METNLRLGEVVSVAAPGADDLDDPSSVVESSEGGNAGAASGRAGLSPWLRLFWGVLSRFKGEETEELVKTTVSLPAVPERCWTAVVFYEEIPGVAPRLLRAVLPAPVRTRGSKSGPGAQVDCVYTSGFLTKRIVELSPPNRLVFDVVASHLGIEDCASAVQGAYILRPTKTGSEIVLTTLYRTALGPRWMFRPLEAWVMHSLHRYVLHGLVRSLKKSDPGFGLGGGTTSTTATTKGTTGGSDAGSDDTVSTTPLAARGSGSGVAV